VRDAFGVPPKICNAETTCGQPLRERSRSNTETTREKAPDFARPSTADSSKACRVPRPKQGQSTQPNQCTPLLPSGNFSDSVAPLKADSTTALFRFQKEFDAFCAELRSNPKKKKKLEFIDRIKDNTSSPEAIEDELGKLVKSAKDKKLRRAYSHIQHVMEAVKDYTGVVEVMSMWESHPAMRGLG
jgi:hypothetical protein